MQNVFSQILIVTLVMAVGFSATKLKLIDEQIKAGLTRIVLLIAVPASIMSAGSLTVTGREWSNVFYVLLIATIYHLALFYFMKYIGSKWFPTPEKGKIAVLNVTFGNVMFLGYPIVKGVFGLPGLFFASIFCAVFNLFAYTIGVRLLMGHKPTSIKDVLLTPFNFAIVVMFVLLFTQYKLPAPIQQTLELLGGLATPLSLITIGAMIAETDLRKLFLDRFVYLNSFLRCLVVPLITLGILYLVPLDAFLRKVIVALAAMPAAATVAMLAEQHGCEPEFASFSVVQSTIFFAGTFPLIMFLTNLLIP
jgi:predicted permease